MIEVRQFEMTYGRSGEITTRWLCNGSHHFPWSNIRTHVPEVGWGGVTSCDSKDCKGDGSEPAPLSTLNILDQYTLKLLTPIPQGYSLVVTSQRNSMRPRPSVHADPSGALVVPGELEDGILLANGTCLVFTGPVRKISDEGDYYIQRRLLIGSHDNRPSIHVSGKPNSRRVQNKIDTKRRQLFAALSDGDQTLLIYQMLLDIWSKLTDYGPQAPGSQLSAQIAQAKRFLTALRHARQANELPLGAYVPVELPASTIEHELAYLEEYLKDRSILA